MGNKVVEVWLDPLGRVHMCLPDSPQALSLRATDHKFLGLSDVELLTSGSP